MKTFNHETINKLMADRKWNSSDLHRAIFLDYANISTQAINSWLSGKITPSAKYLAILSDVLGVSIDDFFTEQKRRNNERGISTGASERSRR